MKTNLTTIKLFALSALMVFGQMALAQQAELQYYRYNDKRGINVYEDSKQDTVKFDGVKVRVGGDFAIQYQGLSHSNDFAAGDPNALQLLISNFNLPTANLNLDVQLLDGVRLHLRTYLSSRHHSESWVKGGYLQIDNLNFVSEGFLSGLMDITTIRFGYNDINYGDAHFRRSDNGSVIYNPFVANFIMDSFTTEPFGEVTLQKSGIIGVLGFTNGRLNQTTSRAAAATQTDDGFVTYLKLGYDKQINDDFRFRLTGSYYTSNDKGTRDYLYGGDRAGARYYEVYNKVGENNDFKPRWNPGFAYHSAFQINPFLKFKGLEFFGIYEVTSNGNDDVGGKYTQTAGELLYRFGGNEQFYLGARLNGVNGFASDAAEDADQERKISRQNYAFGWFMSNNIVVKLEYVTENRKGSGWTATEYQGAKFDGIMLEAAISF